jgi:signal transduction histidine kinase
VPTLYVLRGPDKGQTFRLADESGVLGRSSDTLSLTDTTVSREHADLVREQDNWVLVDRGSSNGTYLNGTRITAPTPIKHGDQIKIGSTLLVFSGDDSVERFSGPRSAGQAIDWVSGQQVIDSSILSAVSSSEDSVILATPETADAVHAWNVMYRIAEVIGGATAVDELLEQVTDIMFDHLPVDRVFILMRDPESGEFEPHIARYRSKVRGKRTKIQCSRTIINHVIERSEGILCANAEEDPRFAKRGQSGSIHDLSLRSIICVPVPTHDEVEGVIHVDTSMLHHVYTHDQLRLVSAIGRLAGMAIENIRLLESRMRHERLAAMGETVAYLSHHIRNIAQGLRSGGDVIELGLRNESLDPIATGWKIIQRNLERTLLLTSNMLTFSKERKPVLELAQLNKVIDDVVNLVRGPADEKGVMVLVDPEDIPSIPLDVEGIHGVLLNIVINAIDACPTEGGRVNIKSGYDAGQSEATVAITDNGAGIPEDALQEVFEAFHSSKGHAGTGLGLAAARKVMTELRGAIDVASGSGEGTTFTVRIPSQPPTDIDSDQTLASGR